MQKIVIAEDDEKLRQELEIFLKRNGYEAIGLVQYDNTVNDILAVHADLVLLDINLPNQDGQYLLKEIRKVSDVPVIMITSRDNELDELLSMNYGADHYVTKPFNTQILLAKIVAILKRTSNVTEKEQIKCGRFILDISKSRIEKDGNKIELTGNELKILKYLIKYKGTIVSREDLMNYLWDSEAFIDDNTLTVNITRVRNKLGQLGETNVIETKRGQGYIIAE